MKTALLARLFGAALAGALVFGLPLTLPAQSASSYVASANDKFRQGDFDSAIADFTKALELNSSYIGAYNGRGLAKNNQGNFDGAIADFSQVIHLKPALVEPYLYRANAEFLQGNFDAAITDFTKVIELSPDNQVAYFHRGLALDCQTNFGGAAADYAKALTLKATNEETMNYTALQSALLSKRFGQDSGAVLNKAAGWTNAWTRTLAQYMTGKASETTLLYLADSIPGDNPAQRSQALYFVGVMKVIGGNKAAARENFQQSANQSGPATIVHRMAQSELDRN